MSADKEREKWDDYWLREAVQPDGTIVNFLAEKATDIFYTNEKLVHHQKGLASQSEGASLYDGELREGFLVFVRWHTFALSIIEKNKELKYAQKQFDF